MFSCKTSELLRMKTRAELAGKKCLLIKYCLDNRYDAPSDRPFPQGFGLLKTHNMNTASALISSGKSLTQTLDFDLSNYSDIFIDEVQFFDDAPEVCDNLAERGFNVVACGLNGDYLQRPFSSVSRLIPLVDKLTFLTAVDTSTGQDAPFSLRIVENDQLEVIGGADTYVAGDRSSRRKYNKVETQ